MEPLISAREAEALIHQAVDERQVIDEYNGINEVSGISGHYYTLGDGIILRQYYDATGAYKYEYVESIPEDQTGEMKEVGSEVVSFILDFIPILSNIKAAIEAFSGENLITGREIGDVERAVLAAAILGGPIVKGARVVGKAAMKQLPKVKNVLHPEKVKSLAKGFYDEYIQKGTSVFKDLVQKVADIPAPPLTPSLATTNGMAFSKTIGETMKEAKETIVQMAGKVKGSVSGKGSGENDNYFTGTLKGEKIHLKGVKVEEIIYTKRLPEETAKLRKDFNSSIRKKFLKEFANDPVRVKYLRKASLGEDDIARMKDGLNPKGWQVHHNLPLDDGGTNDFTNLVLIKNDPYHKAVTNEQISLTRGLAPKQSKTIKWPMFEDDVYPAKPFKRREE